MHWSPFLLAIDALYFTKRLLNHANFLGIGMYVVRP
jgi:hypothetical protein